MSLNAAQHLGAWLNNNTYCTTYVLGALKLRLWWSSHFEVIGDHLTQDRQKQERKIVNAIISHPDRQIDRINGIRGNSDF